jgi:para-nitrobenzyl esterase
VLQVADTVNPKEHRDMIRAVLPLLWLTLASASPLASAVSSDASIAQTKAGAVRGTPSADGKVSIFRGIPFAAPPVGALRWREPQPVAPWTEVRDATHFSQRCMQPDLMKMVFRDSGMGEDCLYLNIWTPATRSGASLPVMVWIYGGSFAIGSGSEARYDGEVLARQGVIVVTLNYRLGVFGFFSTREMQDESPHHSAGNYGYLDQSAAIHWVHDNIAAFGGNPDNITLFGESAGAFGVVAQITSPLTRGIVAKAIGESGGGLGRSVVPVPDLATAEKEDEKFAKDSLHAPSLAALRALSAEELAKKTVPKLFTSMPTLSPVIDGWFLTEPIAATWATGQQAHIPVLAGSNLDEAPVSVAKLGNFNPVALNLALLQKFGLHAGEAQGLFKATDNPEAVRAGDDLNGMEFVSYTVWSLMEAQGNTPQPAFRYEFDLATPIDAGHPAPAFAFHSDELEYVFGTLDSRPGYHWRPEDYRLSTQIQAYWTNFAKHGDPNGEGLPVWPAYKAADGWQLQHLDAQTTTAQDHFRDRYLFFQKYWSK